jgi:hypothetical protein
LASLAYAKEPSGEVRGGKTQLSRDVSEVSINGHVISRMKQSGSEIYGEVTTTANPRLVRPARNNFDRSVVASITVKMNRQRFNISRHIS